MISSLSILNLIAVLLSVSFQIIQVRYFGASFQTDVYYLTIGIIQFVSMLFTGFIADLYIPIYNDIKVRSSEDCKKFAGGIFILMAILSFTMSLIVALIAPFLLKLFASGFSYDKLIFSSKMLQILSVSIFFNSLTFITNATLNANMYMSITYLTNLIPPMFNLISLLFFARSYGIKAIIYSLVAASIVNFFSVFLHLIKKVNWTIANPFTQPDIPILLKKNIPMRAGGLIYQLQLPVTSTVLSYFPSGYITLFNYTLSTLNIILKVTNTAFTQVLQVNLSAMLSKQKFEEAKLFLLSIIKNNIVLFVCVLMPSLVLLKKIFTFIFVSKLTTDQISMMYYILLALTPYYFIQVIEAPISTTTAVLKNGKIIAQAAFTLVMSYSLFLMASKKYFAIYSIPIALFLAEFLYAIVYIRFVQSKFDFLNVSMIKLITLCSIFVGLLIIINIFFQDNFYYYIIFNFFLILAWLCIAKNHILSAFQFIMRKDIIK